MGISKPRRIGGHSFRECILILPQKHKSCSRTMHPCKMRDSKSIAYRQGTSTREGPQSVNYPRPPL